MEASRISGGNSTYGRVKGDLYPTPPEVTYALLDFLGLPSGTRIWEPACGNGDMVREMETWGYRVTGTDISMGQDFLTAFSVPCDWIITNPPFSLSEEFIRRCWHIGKPFALLLKSQFWHARKRIQLFKEEPPAWVLPLTWRPDFLFKTRGAVRLSWMYYGASGCQGCQALGRITNHCRGQIWKEARKWKIFTFAGPSTLSAATQASGDSVH